MNIIGAAKAGVGLVTSFGVGAIIGNAIKATTPATLKPVSKALIFVGSFAITSAVGDLAANYVEKQIQDVVDGVAAAAEKIREAKTGETAEAARQFRDSAENLFDAAKDEAETVVDKLAEEDDLPTAEGPDNK